jgi:hypothetical protein
VSKKKKAKTIRKTEDKSKKKENFRIKGEMTHIKEQCREQPHTLITRDSNTYHQKYY